MMICHRGHEAIIFRAEECPICELLAKLKEMERKLRILEEMARVSEDCKLKEAK